MRSIMALPRTPPRAARHVPAAQGFISFEPLNRSAGTSSEARRCRVHGRMNQYAAAQRAYTESAVTTASPEQLVVMLYDGAIRFLRQGAGAYQSSDIVQAHDRIRRAEAIINELNYSLDMKLRRAPAAPALDLPLLQAPAERGSPAHRPGTARDRPAAARRAARARGTRSHPHRSPSRRDPLRAAARVRRARVRARRAQRLERAGGAGRSAPDAARQPAAEAAPPTSASCWRP